MFTALLQPSLKPGAHRSESLDLLDLRKVAQVDPYPGGDERHPERALSELEVKAEAEELIETLGRNNAQLYVPRRDLDYALHVGLRMLTLRRLVDEADGLYRARPNEARLLAYYANSIAHLIR
ncbi:MAG: hypothetical protein ACM3IK_14125 [Sphingomonadaceae bacterium]